MPHHTVIPAAEARSGRSRRLMDMSRKPARVTNENSQVRNPARIRGCLPKPVPAQADTGMTDKQPDFHRITLTYWHQTCFLSIMTGFQQTTAGRDHAHRTTLE